MRSRVLLVLAVGLALALAEVPWGAAGPPLDWRTDLESALGEARHDARPAMISFHANWCSICDRLDRRTLRKPEVAAELERFVIVRVDASRLDATSQALLERFGVSGVPSLVFIDPEGRVLDVPRARGFVEPELLLEVLRSVG
jgi:thiol:disulfide interchange protein DsbD